MNIVNGNWQEEEGYSRPHINLNIYYDPVAYAKVISLVYAYPVEIGWYSVVKPYLDGYKVCDVLVYPQKVSAGYISVNTPNWGLWKATLTEDQDAHLDGNGHSHVNMAPTPSITDEKQQHDGVVSKGKGFYLFEIWNKQGDVNMRFYDIDNKIFYEDEDINMFVEEIDEFVWNSSRLVERERYGSQQVV